MVSKPWIFEHDSTHLIKSGIHKSKTDMIDDVPSYTFSFFYKKLSERVRAKSFLNFRAFQG